MEHPGQPRVCAVGEAVELAPRDPDPSVDYEWSLLRAPAGSAATVGGEAVQWFEPDRPGRYRLRLTGGGATHDLSVHAFAAETAPGVGEREGYSADETARTDDLAGDPEEAGVSGPGGSGLRTRGGDDDPERPRIHLRSDVGEDAVRVEADVRPRGRGGDAPRVEFMLDDRDDLTESDVTVEGTTLSVPLDRLPDRARVYAVPVTEDAYGVQDAVDVRRDGGDVVVDRPYDPPEWALDSTIYEVYVRTFAEADHEGSAFEAIRGRLDDLADLGVDTLWLTPVLQHDGAPHGYNITDFFSIASDLGTREEYEALVEAAHDRGMSVLFDLVCNHSARDHPFFEDAYGNPDSEYYSWYEWQEDGEPGTYFEWEYIANFDFTSLDVRRHLLDVVDEWAPLVDGFRCDMAWAVPNGFWREVHDRVKERDAEFFLLDETIPYIPDFQAGLFDMHFDSTTAFCLREVGDGNQRAEEVLDAVEERRRIGFPEHASFMLYHENHDESRYLASYGEAAAFASAGALATLPGAPMVYAGQEFGQLGKRDQLDHGSAREDLREHYRRLLALRGEHPALAHRAALSRVDYEVSEGDADAVVAYAREPADEGADAESVVVALNFAEGTAAVTVDADVGGTDLVAGDAVVDGDGTVAVDDVVVLPVRE
ncbi:alpha-amylase MalA [Halobaculum sp. EA56]|uniref:alpha-amylase MalA n=1 Tax=Halobaculum sp. EA56 TaxID=3421648 RepID=UPI003EB8348A